MNMENVSVRMTREAAVREAQRIADETGIYMLVLFDKNQSDNLSEAAYFPATIEELHKSQDVFLLAAGFGPRK
jgi:hypothetical protein